MRTSTAALLVHLVLAPFVSGADLPLLGELEAAVDKAPPGHLLVFPEATCREGRVPGQEDLPTLAEVKALAAEAGRPMVIGVVSQKSSGRYLFVDQMGAERAVVRREGASWSGLLDTPSGKFGFLSIGSDAEAETRRWKRAGADFLVLAAAGAGDRDRLAARRKLIRLSLRHRIRILTPSRRGLFYRDLPYEEVSGGVVPDVGGVSSWGFPGGFGHSPSYGSMPTHAWEPPSLGREPVPVPDDPFKPKGEGSGTGTTGFSGGGPAP